MLCENKGYDQMSEPLPVIDALHYKLLAYLL